MTTSQRALVEGFVIIFLVVGVISILMDSWFVLLCCIIGLVVLVYTRNKLQ